MPLNANAPVFVPAEQQEYYVCDAESDYSEENITEEELAEIEATEEWCAELAYLEELEIEATEQWCAEVELPDSL